MLLKVYIYYYANVIKTLFIKMYECDKNISATHKKIELENFISLKENLMLTNAE